MDLSTIIDFIIKGILAISQLALFIYVRNETRNDKTQERIKAVEDKQAEHGVKIAALSEADEHGPTHHDLGLLYDQLRKVDNNVSTMSGQLDGLQSNVRLIMNRIMEKGLP